jgi:hypothetical protein
MIHDVDNAQLLGVLKEVRAEMQHQRTLLLQSIDQGRSLEMHVDMQLLAISQRVNELKGELELMIKSELLGVFGDLEIRRARGWVIE